MHGWPTTDSRCTAARRLPSAPNWPRFSLSAQSPTVRFRQASSANSRITPSPVVVRRPRHTTACDGMRHSTTCRAVPGLCWTPVPKRTTCHWDADETSTALLGLTWLSGLCSLSLQSEMKTCLWYRQDMVISASYSTWINQSLAYARGRIWSACRDGEIAMHTRRIVKRGTRRTISRSHAAARANVAWEATLQKLVIELG